MNKELRPASILGGLLAVGLISIGILLGNSIVKFKKLDRSVKVKGLAEREVKASKAIWPITFYNESNTIDELYKQIEVSTDKLLVYLKARDFKGSEITKGVPNITDNYTYNYNNTNKIKFRYRSKRTITVYTDSVDNVLKTKEDIINLGKRGIIVQGYDDYGSKTEFVYTGLNSIKPEMIEEATKNAREVALKFAKDSKSRLGKIKSANQGQFSIYNRDSNTPHIKKVRVVSTLNYYLVD